MTGTRTTLGREEGASAVEYALLLAAIAAVIAAVVFTLGILTRDNFGGACSSWNTAASTAVAC